MFRNRRRTPVARVAVAGAAALLAVGISACTGSSSSTADISPSPFGSASSTAAAAPGGTVRVALPAGVTPSYIWPYMPRTDANEYNAEQFQMLMYRPLYMFGGNSPSVSVNYPLSLAHAPVYSADGKTVTITMKGWKWSNGESVDASDVVFWLNMMQAEPGDYYGYVPGLLPDNLAGYSATGPDTVVLHLKSAVSRIWFTYNQLAEITPMPAAWDVTSAGAKPGSGGCATDTAADKWAKCAAVYDFMSAQARNVKTYATNPVWGVVDGPWKLAAFAAAASGPVTTFAANTAYSGSPKPLLAHFTYYAYPDDSAEYKALKTGQLDIGYVPQQDLTPAQAGQLLPTNNPLGAAFTLSPAYQFSIEYLRINFNNPTVGPAFKQLYVRQALQELVDQEGIITTVQHGYGYPTYASVPSQPQNQWTPVAQSVSGGPLSFSFTYSVADATALLTAHGWQPVGGVLTCKSPGTGKSQCGPGVSAGSKLSLTMDYENGVGPFQQESSIMKADFGQAGVQLNLVPQSSDTIVGESAPCKPTSRSCTWEIVNSAGWNFAGPGFEPTGEALFATGAPSNSGSYSDPEMDSDIALTHTSDSLNVFQNYATYAADQLPFIWMPNAYTVEATSGKLANVGSSPLGTLLPEYWYFAK